MEDNLSMDEYMLTPCPHCGLSLDEHDGSGFCLSSKMFNILGCDLYYKDHIKEFIKIVEAIIMNKEISRREKINQLHSRAGEALI